LINEWKGPLSANSDKLGTWEKINKGEDSPFIIIRQSTPLHMSSNFIDDVQAPFCEARQAFSKQFDIIV